MRSASLPKWTLRLTHISVRRINTGKNPVSMSTHQPDLTRSCQRFTETAMPTDHIKGTRKTSSMASAVTAIRAPTGYLSLPTCPVPLASNTVREEPA